MFVSGWIVDGHVFVKAVRKLLSERRDIAGITLSGIPPGSFGMAGETTEPLAICAVARDGKAPTVYATE